jgi:isocitrate dehydrogenase (NAD+)
MSERVTLIPGDGIGPEVTAAAQAVIAAAGVSITWDVCAAGAAAAEETGSAVPRRAHRVDSAQPHRAQGAPWVRPSARAFAAVNVTLRRALDLYACVRPVRSCAGFVPARYDGVDLVVVRENTEGLYSGIEHMVVPGVAESLKIVTERACQRITEFAYRHARAQGRRKVTVLHKANIMKLTDGMFLDVAPQGVAAIPRGRDARGHRRRVRMGLVRDPSRFDVLVMDNLYGDILSDLTAGLVGGLGVVPGANIGDECAVFEAVHGSAPDIAGKGVANPTALILSAAMMLQYHGRARRRAAHRGRRGEGVRHLRRAHARPRRRRHHGGLHRRGDRSAVAARATRPRRYRLRSLLKKPAMPLASGSSFDCLARMSARRSSRWASRFCGLKSSA